MGRDLAGLGLIKRRELLQRFVTPLDRLRISQQFEVPASDILSAVRAQKLEGIVAKRKDSVYQAGQRTGAWSKYRVNRGQELVNCRNAKESRWGDALTEEKMKQCVWLVPKVVAQIEFLEWTGADRLRHSKFVGLRDDKDPRTVVKEARQ